MIVFKRKLWSSTKDKLALAISGTGLGLSAANLAINSSRHSEARDYQQKQLKAMDKLTTSIRGLDRRLESQSINNSKPSLNNVEKKKKRRKSIFKLI